MRPERSVNRGPHCERRSAGQIRIPRRDFLAGRNRGRSRHVSVHRVSRSGVSAQGGRQMGARECETGTASVICADRGYDYARLLAFRPTSLLAIWILYRQQADLQRDLGAGSRSIHRRRMRQTQRLLSTRASNGRQPDPDAGALGGRVDHELANLMLLVRIAMLGRQAEAFDNVCRVLAVAADSKPRLPESRRLRGSPHNHTGVVRVPRRKPEGSGVSSL